MYDIYYIWLIFGKEVGTTYTSPMDGMYGMDQLGAHHLKIIHRQPRIYSLFLSQLLLIRCFCYYLRKHLLSTFTTFSLSTGQRHGTQPTPFLLHTSTKLQGFFGPFDMRNGCIPPRSRLVFGRRLVQRGGWGFGAGRLVVVVCCGCWWVGGVEACKARVGIWFKPSSHVFWCFSFFLETKNHENYHNNGTWTRIEDVFPIENMNVPLLCRQFTGG